MCTFYPLLCYYMGVIFRPDSRVYSGLSTLSAGRGK